MKKSDITKTVHPAYRKDATYLKKYRLTYEGGRDFVSEYLVRFTTREDTDDFTARQNMTYCPAHAKAAITDIKNAIFQRMSEVTRMGGSDNYMRAVRGQLGGVDLTGSSMNNFLGTEVIDRLLVERKVGIYIDNFQIPQNPTMKDVKDLHPYLYIFPVDQIRSWNVDKSGNFTVLLLENYIYDVDVFGLIKGQNTEYQLYALKENSVEVRFFDKKGLELTDRATVLNIPKIPFVVPEIRHSLLRDVADYQIALLNIESSDISYILKSNFPFYTEQFDQQYDVLMQSMKAAQEAAGDEDLIDEDKEETINDVKVGQTQGRRYPKDLDRPGFIHPSSEPLNASMQKESNIKQDIRMLVNLAISQLAERDGSEESKKMDERGLEAGLSSIGAILEKAERQIAEIWNLYEEGDKQATVNYPEKYDLKSDDDRREEAKELRELLGTIPSKTFQKDVAKEISSVIMRGKTTVDRITMYHDEIEQADVIITDPEVIHMDHENGFVSTEFASKMRGYPEGQVEQAKLDHAERLKRIAIAQTLGAARGVDDAGGNPNDGKDEKTVSRNTDQDGVVTDKTRGKGKNNDDTTKDA
jgi:hypothetical protein